jgi:hypothetical protein
VSWLSQRNALAGRGHALQETLEGVTVTIGGTAYAASAGPVRTVPVLVSGGEIDVRTRTFVIRAAILATPPEEGTTLTSSGKTWRVAEVSYSPSALVWRISATQPTERP